DSDCVSSIRDTDVLAARRKRAARPRCDVDRRAESGGALCASGPCSLCGAAGGESLCSNLVDCENVVSRDDVFSVCPTLAYDLACMGRRRVLTKAGFPAPHDDLFALSVVRHGVPGSLSRIAVFVAGSVIHGAAPGNGNRRIPQEATVSHKL